MAQLFRHGQLPQQAAHHQLLVVLATLLRPVWIAISHQLLHLVALEPLQPALKVDAEALALVVVAKSQGGIGGDAAEAIHQAAQVGAAQHQKARWLARVEAYQAAHRISGEGYAADAIEAAETLGAFLAR